MNASGSDRSDRQGVRPDSNGRSSEALDPVARKEQQLVFLLTRQLVDAQIVRGDRERSERLWQEVAALELDPERITALMYGVGDHDDLQEMEAVDRQQRSHRATAHGRPWFSGAQRGSQPAAPWRGGARRSAPPAGPRGHRQVR